jgi:uncharacterized protein (TIGR03437 family)
MRRLAEEKVMDTVFNVLRKSALLIPVVLMAVSPWRAEAQTFTSPADGTTVSFGSASNTSVDVKSDRDSSNGLAFNVSITYQDAGDPHWLSIQSLTGGSASSCDPGLPLFTNYLTTPTTLYMGKGCQAAQLYSGTHTATVTLSGSATRTFTVLYMPGTAGGTMTAIPSTYSEAVPPGAVKTFSQAISLTTDSVSPIGFEIDLEDAGTWLSISQSATKVSVGNPALLDLTMSAVGRVSTPPTAHIIIQYSGKTLDIPVTMNVGTAGNLTFSSNPVNWTYKTTGGTAPTPATITLGSTAATYAYQISGNTNPPWLYVNGTGTASGSGVGVSSGLQLSTAPSLGNIVGSVGQVYSANVLVTDSNGYSGTLTVNLTVNGGSSNGISVSPNPLSIALGTNTMTTQMVTVTSSVAGTLSVASSLSSVTVSSAPQTIAAGVATAVYLKVNSGGLNTGTYAGSLTISVAALSQNFPLYVTVAQSAAAGSVILPTSLNFNYQQGSNATLADQRITIAGNGTFTRANAQYTGGTSTGWLTFDKSQGVATHDGATLSVGVVPSVVQALSPGQHTATFVVTTTSSSGQQTPQTIGVTLRVKSSVVLNSSTGSVNLSYASGGTVPNAPGVYVSASDGSAITVQATSTDPWLVPTITANNSTLPVISLQLAPSSLGNGLHAATVTITSDTAGTLVIPVVLAVTGGTDAGTLAVSATTINFNAQVNSTASLWQTLNVTAGTATPYFAATSIQAPAGGTWLAMTPMGNLTTDTSISVSVNPVGLGLGSYNGNVTLITADGTTTNVPITLTISSNGVGGNVTPSPTQVSLTTPSGSKTIQTQTVAVSSAAGAAGVPFTAVVANSYLTPWLSVSPASATTPANLTVSLNPAGLSANTYIGKITITPTGGSPVDVPVTFTVTAPPSIAAVVNAASSQVGPVSPGEIISIYGTALGPATPSLLTLDPSKKYVLTSIGGVTVTIGGTPAPLTYVGDKQINAVVPYEVAASGSGTVSLIVNYQNQASSPYSLQVTSSSPAIFTQDSSGSGPGAILNQDNSVNKPGKPAARGSIIQIFMTGEGATTPDGVTGLVTPGTLPIPAPKLFVGVYIGGQQAELKFDGEAPGAVAGVMQVNAVVPQTVTPGNSVPITIKVGNNTSPSGVTLAVQ